MKLQGPSLIHAAMAGTDRSLGGRAYRLLAGLVEPIYAAAVNGRNRRFDAGRDVHRATRPVISIGNLTTGGTGKTPMTIFVIERLIAMGHRPAVLTRGYKSGPEAQSDEATLLADRLPDVPIIVNPDRVGGASEAAVKHRLVDVLVMDDGFQHRRLARDLDLVLIDATCPWGHGRLLPRGMLREPIDSLGRAQAVIVTHADRIDSKKLDELDRTIALHHGRPPRSHMHHSWRAIVDQDNQPVDPAGRRVVACCAIGNPQAFFDAAAQRTTVAATWAFPDHHAYRFKDVRRLGMMLAEHQAQALLTTEKDWVKLRHLQLGGHRLPVWRAVLAMEAREGPDVLDPLLAGVFG